MQRLDALALPRPLLRHHRHWRGARGRQQRQQLGGQHRGGQHCGTAHAEPDNSTASGHDRREQGVLRGNATRYGPRSPGTRPQALLLQVWAGLTARRTGPRGGADLPAPGLLASPLQDTVSPRAGAPHRSAHRRARVRSHRPLPRRVPRGTRTLGRSPARTRRTRLGTTQWHPAAAAGAFAKPEGDGTQFD